jgi:hypothetical protein
MPTSYTRSEFPADLSAFDLPVERPECVDGAARCPQLPSEAKDVPTAPQQQPGAILPGERHIRRARQRAPGLAGLAITAFVISLRRRGGHVGPLFHLYAGDELVTAVLRPKDRSFALSDVEPLLAERVDDIRLVRN